MLALVWGLSACGVTQAPSNPSVPLAPTPSVAEVCGIASVEPGKPIALQCGKRMFAFNLQALSIQDCTLKKTYELEGGDKIYLYSCKESETLFAFYWNAKDARVSLYKVPSLPCNIPIAQSKGYTISK